MSDFDPSKYLTTRVHGGVREIVGEEAKKIRERTKKRLLEMGIVIPFKCPLKDPECKENCGSYGCGN